jgi:hypothetical protein
MILLSSWRKKLWGIFSDEKVKFGSKKMHHMDGLPAQIRTAIILAVLIAGSSA